MPQRVPSGSSLQPRSASRTARGVTGGQGDLAGYPESVQRLILELSSLPGIGRRSAERLAFHVLKSAPERSLALARALEDVKRMVKHCRICFNFSDSDGDPAQAGECTVCRGARETAQGALRDGGVVMVVEQPRDIIPIEQTGMYRGVYHVLMGRLSPLDGVGPGDVTIAELLARVDDAKANSGGVRVAEVILALNPTMESDGTALYLAEHLGRRPVSLSRLARGLPSGSSLEFASKAVLADAIHGRQKME